MNIVEPIIRRALATPDAPAIIAGQQTITYGALMRDVAAASSRLAGEGVRRGDVVGIVCEGLAGHLLATLATARIGAVSVPLGQTPLQEVGVLAQACGVGMVLYEEAHAPQAEASGIAKRLSLRELTSTRPHTIVPMVRSEPSDLFRIAFSSGTTGRQKPVKFSHGNMALRSHLLRTVFPAAPGERTMVCLGVGLHFSLGYILRSLLTGGAVVDRGETVGATAEAIRTHEVNMLITSPGTAVQLVQLALADPGYATPAPTLRTLCLGGARLPPTLHTLLRRHVCPGVYANYGMTEAGGLVAQADSALLESHPAAAGRLMPWVEVDVIDDSGKSLPFGTEGRLRVRSPTLADGYIGVDPQGSADVFRDGWFYSGDIGTVTGDGVVFLGSRSDVLNLGGVKVKPEVIEAVIGEDPAILDCVALTLTDQAQTHLVAAVVAPAGFDAQALRQRCASRLGQGMVPEAVVALESLPHNAAGKIQRQELPALVARRLAEVRALEPGSGNKLNG